MSIEVVTRWKNAQIDRNAARAATICAAELHRKADQLQASAVEHQARGGLDAQGVERIELAAVMTHALAAALDNAAVLAADADGPESAFRDASFELGSGLVMALSWNVSRTALHDLRDICSAEAIELRRAFSELQTPVRVEDAGPLMPVVIAYNWLREVASRASNAASDATRGAQEAGRGVAA